MKKLGRNTLAVGLATLLVTSAVAFSAQADETPVAQSEARLVNGTGLFEILDTGDCVALTTNGDDAEPEGRCGTGLEFAPLGVITQNAEAGLDGSAGVSAAQAQTAGVDLPNLSTIELADLPASLENIDTGTILDDVIVALRPVLGVLEPVLRGLLGAIDGVLDPILAQLDLSLPISVEIGAVDAVCEAAPGSATGNGSVAGIDIVVDLGGQQIRVPVSAGTDPNSSLVVDAPGQLVDDILIGVRETLTQSLGGALVGLGDLVEQVRTQLVNRIIDAIRPTLLESLSEALAPVVTGTVNRQETGPGEIDVTALDITLLGNNRAEIGQVSCGPNSTFVADVVDDGPGAADDVDGPGNDVGGRDGGPGGAIADADAQADADVTVALPNAGAPNLLPFWLLGLGLVLFGAAVMINERRRALL